MIEFFYITEENPGTFYAKICKQKFEKARALLIVFIYLKLKS